MTTTARTADRGQRTVRLRLVPPSLGRAVRRPASALLFGMALLTACTSGTNKTDTRLWSDSYQLRITTDPLPPHAREATLYKIVVRDRENGQPIESGEGVIYATNADQRSIWDSFQKGPEVGTYYSKLNFVTAGDWALAVEFRADSTKRLEKMEWRQDVRAARGEAVQ